MPGRNDDRLRHLLLSLRGESEQYTSPSSVPRSRRIPDRVRQQHGARLLRQIRDVEDGIRRLSELRQDWGVEETEFVYLEFQAEPSFALKLESLEDLRASIELLSVVEREGTTYATVLVPSGQLGTYVRKIEDYLQRDTRSGRPRNEELVAGISSIRIAALESLWTDDPTLFPQANGRVWWEVWIRAGQDRQANIQRLSQLLSSLDGVSVGEDVLSFPERSVLLVYASRAELALSLDVLDVVAELRAPKLTAADLLNLDARHQAEWAMDLASRVRRPGDAVATVTILDTGVNNGHSLISPLLHSSDLHSCNPTWGTGDHHGHGTEMAGVAAYGDLIGALESSGPVDVSHILESVKILPPTGQNDPKLYGSLTIEAVSRAEANAANRKRVACMAVTANDTRDGGRPSSWSSAVDSACYGDGADGNVFVISVGNCRIDTAAEYPSASLITGIHDPCQAWNALGVGAYTEKVDVDTAVHFGHTAIAPFGDLSPFTTTSVTWGDEWPIKPDVVFEGGNLAAEPTAGVAVHVDSLTLLTTNYQPASVPFTWTAETSAATAMAANFAAKIRADYPEFWPETVRGLIVHSSDWTDAMRRRFAGDKRSLLRSCGYGVPSLARARWSASSALTMVQQDVIQPFVADRSSIRTNEMRVYQLPWPVEQLQDLLDTEVTLRVTLSYFIEPNPSRTYGVGSPVRRHQYRSAGLRFDMKTATETLDEFRRRINRAARDEGEGSQTAADQWKIGRILRNKGSLHSDTWVGSAADLAEKRYLAVYPVSGWWRYNKGLAAYEKALRFSLIVSIDAPDVDVDMYSVVEAQVSQAVEV